MSAEARGGLHIVEQSLWAAIPAYMRKLNAALKKHTGRELPIGTTPLTFGSWMGGDRDGNPNVTAQVCTSHPCSALLLMKTGKCIVLAVVSAHDISLSSDRPLNW